ncbi:MAG: hypothetical protein GF317_01490 [Candidatus Lokiarchaeota archaeon]|nr:hypothetical protein [Candidatus Lokiarchaeota archaeon]MBD3198617.1 hypothetical protein [Candidatus Lokiarchaeota archaeon]
MNKNYEIEIPKNQYLQLQEISRILHVSINDLIQYSLNELFDLIQTDTLIFLDSIGISEKLKEIAEKFKSP